MTAAGPVTTARSDGGVVVEPGYSRAPLAAVLRGGLPGPAGGVAPEPDADDVGARLAEASRESVEVGAVEVAERVGAHASTIVRLARELGGWRRARSWRFDLERAKAAARRRKVGRR